MRDTGGTLNITVNAAEPKDNKVEAKITVAAADVDKAIKAAYKDIANRYNFQGFRKGKTPRPVIDGIVGREAVLAQASNDVVNQVEPLMLEELDLVPVNQPDFGEDVATVVEGSDFELTCTIEVRPSAELDSYDAPEINMPPEEATEAEVAQQLEQLLSYRATFEDVEEDRAVEADDIVSLTVENVENCEQLAGENRMVQLGQNSLPQELNDALVGMKKGETKEVAWTQEHDHEHDGETEHHVHNFACKVTVEAIKKQVTPELTDELAKSSFGYDTVEELKSGLKEEIENDKKTSLPNLKEDRVVEVAAERLQLDEVPANYTEQIFNELAQSFMNQLQQSGLTLDTYLQMSGISAQSFIDDLREQASERARQSLALDAIARHFGYEATDEDVVAEFTNAGSKDVEADIKSWKDAGRLPAIRDSIKRNKALNWLVDNAKVTIVDEIAERRAAEKSDEAAE